MILDPIILNNFVEELNDGTDGMLIKFKATERWLVPSGMLKPGLKFKINLHFTSFKVFSLVCQFHK